MTGISIWDVREDGSIVGTYLNERNRKLRSAASTADVIFMMVLTSRKARPLLDDGGRNAVRWFVPGMRSAVAALCTLQAS